jgi:hypothetical protein
MKASKTGGISYFFLKTGTKGKNAKLAILKSAVICFFT